MRSVHVFDLVLGLGDKLCDAVFNIVIEKQFGAVRPETMVGDVVSCSDLFDGYIEGWGERVKPQAGPQVCGGEPWIY